MLTHPTNQCCHPPTYKWCGFCGKPGHLQTEHNAKHCGKQHPTLGCNCDATCFNCFYCNLPIKSHYAFNDTCPLKKNMR